MGEEIGGFFASLKLNVDGASFQRGVEGMRGVGDQLSKLIKIGLGIAGVTVGFKELLSAADRQGKLLLTANYLQMSAEAVTTWSGAITEAGGNASAFIDAIKQLHQNLVRMKEEGMDPGTKFFQNIAQLGVNPGDLVGMTQDQQVRTLMNAARNSKNPNLANDLILQLLGPEALNAVLYSRATGRGIDKIRSDWAKTEFSPNRAGALAGMGELRRTGGAFQGMWESLSSKLVANLSPELKRLNDWLGAHQDEIAQMIDAMSKLAAAILVGFVAPMAKLASGKATKQDFFPQGLPWEGKFWQNMLSDFKRDFLGGGGVKITIEDRTQGGVKATPSGISDLNNAAATAVQQR